MSEKSRALHSVIFTDNTGTYNTYDTWGLIPVKRPIINTVVTSPVLDHRQDKYGGLLLEDDYSIEVPVSRTGEFEFRFDDFKSMSVSDNGIITQTLMNDVSYRYDARRVEILTLFSGKYFVIELEDEPNRFYKGLVWAEWDNTNPSRIKFKITCEPYAFLEAITYDMCEELNLNTLVSGTTYSVPIYSGFFTPVVIDLQWEDGTTNCTQMTIAGAARDPRTNSSKNIILTDMATDGTYEYMIDGDLKTVERWNTSTDVYTNYFSKCELWRFPMMRPAPPSTGHPRSGLGSKFVANNTIRFTWTGAANAKLNAIITYQPRYI